MITRRITHALQRLLGPDLSKELGYFRPQRTWLIVGAIFAVLTALSSIALLTISGWFITASAVVGLAGITVAGSFNFLYPSAGIRAFALTRTVFRYAERLATHEATFRVLADMRTRFFQAVIPLSPSQVEGQRSGDLLSRLTSDIDALDGLYLRLVVPVITALAVVLAVSVTLAIVHPGAALFALILLLAAGLAAPVLTERYGRAPGAAMQSAQAALRSGLSETFAGRREVVAYGLEARASAQAERETGTLNQARRRLLRVETLSTAGGAMLSHLGVAGGLAIGIAAISPTGLSGQQAALIAFCLMAAFEAIAPMGPALAGLGRMRSAAQRIHALSEAEPLVRDPAPETAAEPPATGALSFKGVSFTYPGTEKSVLQNFSFTLGAGETLALTGPSGCGKSTVLALLLRLYDPQSGAVLFGETPLSAFRQAVLRRRFGYLSQRSEIFAATLRENLALADPSADDTALYAALRQAGLERFLTGLPDGLDTYLGENGRAVSGGEARRIALARVILKDAPILLLDEPTEGLDPQTEDQVMRTLGEIAREKTVLLVTHRTPPAWIGRTLAMGKDLTAPPASSAR